jgi:hypothetical protein
MWLGEIAEQLARLWVMAIKFVEFFAGEGFGRPPRLCRVTLAVFVNSWNGCYQRAGEICGKRGYDILQQSGEKGFVASGDFASTTNNRTMVIRCKGD